MLNFQVDQKKIFVTDHEEIQSIIVADTYDQFKNLKSEFSNFY